MTVSVFKVAAECSGEIVLFSSILPPLPRASTGLLGRSKNDQPIRVTFAHAIRWEDFNKRYLGEDGLQWIVKKKTYPEPSRRTPFTIVYGSVIS